MQEYVVWAWGDRFVNYGKVVEDTDHVLLVEIVDTVGDKHKLALPKGSFRFKFFDTEEEAKEFLLSNVH